jgi:hypothetical protein
MLKPSTCSKQMEKFEDLGTVWQLSSLLILSSYRHLLMFSCSNLGFLIKYSSSRGL